MLLVSLHSSSNLWLYNGFVLKCLFEAFSRSTECILLMLTAEIIQELYQKMSKSVEVRTMPPNAWLWSLISNCANQEDIKLLFQMLQKLRIFVSSIQFLTSFICAHLHHFFAYIPPYACSRTLWICAWVAGLLVHSQHLRHQDCNISTLYDKK